MLKFAADTYRSTLLPVSALAKVIEADDTGCYTKIISQKEYAISPGVK